MSEGLRLRPVAEADLDSFDVMFADPDMIGVFNWGGFGSAAKWRRMWAENRLLAPDKSVLIAELDGAAIGFVSWNRENTSANSYFLEFGISLWPDFRGKGHGTTVQRLLARYLFAHAPINRIQAITDAENFAEQRSLEKAGFTREAELKGRIFRDGAWRDEIMYRMVRSELPTSDGPAT
ncbi:GNAT family N-acetyltransferase [Actinophytocola oryzae]|uniref:RimJ/RimL family protein N-acetyltransferase n=1 Tax=Actinophytocola oryzae TaxID=502181 RepID=A0A4R7VBG3_9PSEU|nr:GNAT family protein [Actinophytocola oryzae]TDV46269.1 RimJ/RimL family protein N-acetyltransferase [Actinophytocola oryzae]